MELLLPCASVSAPSSELAAAIRQCNGALVLTGLPRAPLTAIQNTFDELSAAPEITERLNGAYTKNLVYKDSFASGHGGKGVDKKRVFDLSPERIEQIKSAEPELATWVQDSNVKDWLDFFDTCTTEVMPKLIGALSQATGADISEDSHFNYRMVDYYQRPANEEAPRCGEHRDFGSATLIFSSDISGLQFDVSAWDQPGRDWRPVAPLPADSAVLLFGWCTQIRSNNRIPAMLHRVVDATAVDDVVPRRTSAVFFIAPKSVETPLEPVVLEGEERHYISGIKVGQLRGNMARKWRRREGTLKPEDRVLEEKEIRVTKMATQDDVVRCTVSA